MCIGIPMQVVEVLGPSVVACCRAGNPTPEQIDSRLVGEVAPGDWVLTFLGAARSILTAEDAEQINDALSALEVVMGGGSVDHLFADLINREPELPAHLRPEPQPENKD